MTEVLTTGDLCSLLIFEKLCDDWVREVHKFNSQRKKKKNFVIFRNCENKKVTSLEELKDELEDTAFLDNAEFKSAFSNDIVSNKVGANKIARRAAKAWMAEISGEKISIKGNSKVEEIPVTKKTAPVETKAVEDEATVEKVAALE